MNKDTTKVDMNLISPPLNLYQNLSPMNGTAMDSKVLDSVLIGDTFLIDRTSPSFFVNPLTDSMPNSLGSSTDDDDDCMEVTETNLDMQKPFESFDEQIIMAPRAPPPLEGLFSDDGLLHLNDDNLEMDRNMGMNYDVDKPMTFTPPTLSNDNDELFENDLFDSAGQSDEYSFSAWTDQMS